MCRPEEFAAGFGSHTPMLMGAAQVIRYHAHAARWGGGGLIHLAERGAWPSVNFSCAAPLATGPWPG